MIARPLQTTRVFVLIERFYRYQVESNYLKNRECLAAFFLHFWKVTLNFQCSENKASLISQVFLKLLIPRDVFIYMHKTAWFWKPIVSERVNESQKLSKSLEKYFYVLI